MNHDHLCPCQKPNLWSHWHDDGASCPGCACDLIAKVREDMLTVCIAAVEALVNSDDYEDLTIFRDGSDVILDELRSLQEKP